MTGTTWPDYDAIVAGGIKALDETTGVPKDWRDKIDPETLDMGAGDKCVAGQIFAEFFLAPQAIRHNFAFLRTAEGTNRYKYSGVDDYYDRLAEAWRRALWPEVTA